jgi:CBS-domain-containing membrane protein
MLAEEIMTRDPRTIPMSASIADAVDALESMHVRHLPVVDEQGILVGMISDRDLGPLMKTFIIDATVERMPYPPDERRVTEVMSTSPIALREDAELAEIIDTLIDERVGALPVVDDADGVVGIISYVDVLTALHPDPETASARRRPQRPCPPAG